MRKVVNESPYFGKMTASDLIARKVNNIKEYKDAYVASVQPFTPREKGILLQIIKDVEPYLKQYKYINAIPWNLCKVSTNIEEGYPHTLKDVIILSESFFDSTKEQQKITLLHEKIHVYQRMYPVETQELIINFLGYQVKKENEDIANLKRNNPDVNDLVYGKTDFYIVQLYNSFSPKSLADSYAAMVKDKNSEIVPLSSKDVDTPDMIHQIEHPYEIMASYIPYIILQKRMDPSYIKWMNEYL
jgi:hypothetical protein